MSFKVVKFVVIFFFFGAEIENKCKLHETKIAHLIYFPLALPDCI